MKKNLILSAFAVLMFMVSVSAQELKASAVPTLVKSTLMKKYPSATKITWEKEGANYEANWGGKSGEANSVIYTPNGAFVQIAVLISTSQLPKATIAYVQQHYNGATIVEAAKITDAVGKISYEAEVKGKELLFDETGKFVR